MEKALDEIKQTVQGNIPYEISDFGKLIRSKLGILFVKSLGKPVSKDVISLLSAIELIHTASLLHDDVIDNNNERRNSPSLNKSFGNKKAILYGDIILSDAMSLVNTIDNPEISDIIVKTLHEMCRGELIQLDNIGEIMSVSDYIEKTSLKTGELFRAMIKSLCVLFSVHDYSDFGLNYGIAFQIKNDLDNVSGDRSDIENGIYTAPVIYSGGINITDDAIEKTVGLIDNYRKKSISVLSELEDNIYKEELIGVVKCLIK